MATSMPPQAASMARAAAVTAARSVTSAGTTRTRNRSAPRAISSRRSRRRAVMATRAPRARNAFTSAAPIPVLAPVTQIRELAQTYIGYQRKMIRGNQRRTCARQLDAHDLDPSCVVDVIEMEDGEDAGIGAAAAQVIAQVDAVQPVAEHPCRE